jgi:hypothetical protein
VLQVPEAILEQTFAQFRACGLGRAECVTWWLGPLAEPRVVAEVVHPLHTATAGGYDIAGPWQNEFWLRLASNELELRAQIHTHPGSAFHSSRDDSMAAIQTVGFLSLVIPDFGLGKSSLHGAYLAERAPDGSWLAISPSSRIELVKS